MVYTNLITGMRRIQVSFVPCPSRRRAGCWGDVKSGGEVDGVGELGNSAPDWLDLVVEMLQEEKGEELSKTFSTTMGRRWHISSATLASRLGRQPHQSSEGFSSNSSSSIHSCLSICFQAWSEVFLNHSTLRDQYLQPRRRMKTRVGNTSLSMHRMSATEDHKRPCCVSLRIRFWGQTRRQTSAY